MEEEAVGGATTGLLSAFESTQLEVEKCARICFLQNGIGRVFSVGTSQRHDSGGGRNGCISVYCPEGERAQRTQSVRILPTISATAIPRTQ